MPLYEYRCKQCGHQFEKIQTFSAPDEKICAVCGGDLERLISAPAVQFKGSGFYSTDYARGSSAGSGRSADSGGGSDSASNSSSSGAEKPSAGSSDNGSSSTAAGASPSGSSGKSE